MTGVSVLAGPGDDEVYNESTGPVGQPISLGPGADTFVGTDLAEDVYGDDAAAVSGGTGNEVDRRADVELAGAAACTTRTGAEVETLLSGIESLVGRVRRAMSLRGTDRAERIRISLTPRIAIRSLGGSDRVESWGVVTR